MKLLELLEFMDCLGETGPVMILEGKTSLEFDNRANFLHASAKLRVPGKYLTREIKRVHQEIEDHMIVHVITLNQE